MRHTGDDRSSGEGRSADRADHLPARAPIRQTVVDELDGLYRFAMTRLGHDPDAAEEVVQQSALIAIGHRCPPVDAGEQRAWVRGIVQNVIRHRFRSLRRGRDAIETVARRPRSPAEADSPISTDTRSQHVHALCLAVTALDQSDQELFYAFYRAGRSHAQIAAELGTSCKAVEARLYRLRSRLRQALDECGDSR